MIRHPRRFPLRWRLLVAVGCPLLFVYAVMLVVQFHVRKNAAIGHMEQYLSELVAHHAATLGGKFRVISEIADSTALVVETYPGLRSVGISSLLERIVRENPEVYGAAVAFDPGSPGMRGRMRGPYVCRNGDRFTVMDLAATCDYRTADWYLIPKILDRPVWSEPYFDVGAGNILMCTYSVPFSVPFHGESGVATADVSLDELQRVVGGIVIEDGYCVVVSRSGRFIVHPMKELVMKETVFSLAEWYGVPALAAMGRDAVAGKGGVWRIPDFKTKEPKWYVVAPIAASGWSFAAVLPEKTVMASVYREIGSSFVMMLIGLAMIMAAIFWAAMYITRPLGRLAGAAEEIAAGNLDVRVGDGSAGDEIADLSSAFRTMAGNLKEHIAALTRETAAREAVESELRIARTIQDSLLPKQFPVRPEFSLCAVNVPAREMAGDFYDFYFLDDATMAIAIGDVAGKNVSAALLMAVARTVLRDYAALGIGPAGIFEKANAMLAKENDTGMFVTVFFGLYDIRTGRLTFANAGHNPPFVIGADGTVRPTESLHNPALGIMEEAIYVERTVTLEPGEKLILYTDGVTEAVAPDGVFFGEERFTEELCGGGSLPPKELCSRVIERIKEYEHGDRHDDVTLLILERREEIGLKERPSDQ